MIKKKPKLLHKHDSIKWSDLAHHVWCLAHVINLVVKAFLCNLKIAPLSEEHTWLSRDNIDDDSDDHTNINDYDNDVEDNNMAENNMDDDLEEDEEYDIEDNKDFKSVLQKIRIISKAITITQKHILSSESYCLIARFKQLHLIHAHVIR